MSDLLDSLNGMAFVRAPPLGSCQGLQLSYPVFMIVVVVVFHILNANKIVLKLPIQSLLQRFY